ncbi:hypothetical protein ABIB94_008426 [Bradyrhizobium sp. JR7.2]|uniref:Uncharacterized protein n=1 Tax=Bradyrhizobium barranii TaxID=2992140 RepID=A0ABY3QCZ0_9BRAD|nr:MULTISPECIES: hypothetical protein [Bradyrhizobium]UFW83815.1 hypothetical protein BjapCC829_28135 [Bradyrhizobium japonicum]
MATLSQLVAGIAAVEGIDAERVGAIARAIREHGLIRTSGRGTSAAQMSAPDAANLLIAANMADTARTAPAAVTQYRALRAKRNKQTSEFGSELEEMISAAKQDCLADYITKMVGLLGTRGHVLGRKRFLNETYGISIEFEKPIPSVIVGISVLNFIHSDAISFGEHPGQSSAEARGDRRERTRITQRTIQAVANVLRM